MGKQTAVIEGYTTQIQALTEAIDNKAELISRMRTKLDERRRKNHHKKTVITQLKQDQRRMRAIISNLQSESRDLILALRLCRNARVLAFAVNGRAAQ